MEGWTVNKIEMVHGLSTILKGKVSLGKQKANYKLNGPSFLKKDTS